MMEFGSHFGRSILNILIDVESTNRVFCSIPTVKRYIAPNSNILYGRRTCNKDLKIDYYFTRWLEFDHIVVTHAFYRSNKPFQLC